MNDENKVNYYAIIPATIRYSKDLKPNEKLLYGEITALSNKNGYCYAQNRYFAELYNVSIHTVSQWVSHLEKLNYVKIEMIKNSNKEIKERRIYLNDIPYVQKNTWGIDKNVQDNNINNNIDDFYYLIINNSKKIPKGFYSVLIKLEFLYTYDIISIMEKDKVKMLKEITFTLYDLYNSDFKMLLLTFRRETLINLYILSKQRMPNDLINYYKRAIINKYTNNSS